MADHSPRLHKAVVEVIQNQLRANDPPETRQLPFFVMDGRKTPPLSVANAASPALAARQSPPSAGTNRVIP
jgi:hypothetical protein